MHMPKPILFAIALLSMSAISAQAASAPQYQLKQKFVLGGDGGWDYLAYDAAGNRLFISRATRVMVVDASKGTVLAEIPNTPGVHGIALAQDLGKGFISNGKENSVTVFDLKSLKETARVQVTGENPDAILYEPVSRRVFTFNGHSKNATVIDAATAKVLGSIALDGKPEFAVADGKGMVYVNIEDKSELTRIDAAKSTVLNTWSLAPCTEPSGLAMDPQHRRLFSGCDNKLMAVIDADSGKIVATLPIGEGVDACGFDPGTELAFSSNGDGTLTVIHADSADKYSVVQDAATQKFARTMALDPASHDVYLVTAQVDIIPPPAGSPAGTRPQRNVQPGTFTVLVMSRQ
jgi:DNA-binding beta-propeller fold protein YncE